MFKICNKFVRKIFHILLTVLINYSLHLLIFTLLCGPDTKPCYLKITRSGGWSINPTTMTEKNFYYNAQIEFIVEIIKNKLYFASTYGNSMKLLKSTKDTLYFTTDQELFYMNYYYDFGPLNIGCLYQFCSRLKTYLCCPVIKRIVYYCAGNLNKRTNAAFLMGSFAVIYLKMSPHRAYQLLASAGGAFRDYLDASQRMSNYTLHLIDCFHAIEKAKILNFFDFADFNVMEYELFDKMENGDLNWLLPRKFVAFTGPTDHKNRNTHPPEFYLKYFVRNDVNTVIRLNNKVYDASVFSNAGIEHHELFFADGTTPPKEILMRFLYISEHTPGAIGVHCKAGLGRTGSLIGAYIMKHYNMTATEAIAWMRICRPGSVIGLQQGWLEKIESWLWRQGSHYRLEHFGKCDIIPRHRFGIYSKQERTERMRLIMHANKKAEAQRRLSAESPNDCIRGRQPSYRRQVTKARREYEKENLKEQQQRYAKFLAKRMMKDVERESGKFAAKVFLASNDPKFHRILIECAGSHEVLPGQSDSNRRKKKNVVGEKEEETQGDRLNEIKMKRHRAFVIENNLKEICKTRQRKSEERHRRMVDRGSMM